jgi:hypothetical protein
MQLELLGYWFSINHGPARMMEDANFFSRLGEYYVHLDPILKDYLAFAHQLLYSNSPPSSSDPINEQKYSRKVSKKDQRPCGRWENGIINQLDDRPTKKLIRCWQLTKCLGITQMPQLHYAKGMVQPKSDKHFECITEMVLRLKKLCWCMSQPG